MRCGASNVSPLYPSRNLEIDTSLFWQRPWWRSPALIRRSCGPVSEILNWFMFSYSRVTTSIAYGNSNDLVLEASGIRGQSVVIWDLEWVDLPSFHSSIKLIQRHFSFLSSRDSLDASVQTSKNEYDNKINQHPRPSSILTVNHETTGIVFQPSDYPLSNKKCYVSYFS